MKTIRDRIALILTEVTAITNTTFTIANRVPKSSQDLYGYVAVIRPSSGVMTKEAQGYPKDLQTWLVLIYSPQVGTNLRANQEDNILDYGDAVLDVLASKSRLESSGASLTGVKSSAVTNWELVAPDQYADMNRYVFSITLEIMKNRTTVC